MADREAQFHDLAEATDQTRKLLMSECHADKNLFFASRSRLDEEL